MENSAKTRWWVLGAVVVALVARVGWVLWHGTETVFPDEGQYLEMAENLLGGRGFVLNDGAVASRGPVYPAMVALGLWVGGRGAILAFQILLGTTTVCAIFLLGRGLAGTRRGIAAALVAAIYPYLIYFTGTFLSETMLTFCLVAGAWLLHDAFRHTCWGRALGAGIAFGLAALLQPSFLLLPPVLLVGWPLLRRDLGTGGGSRRLALAFVGGAILTVLPWTVRNRMELGAWVPVTTKMGTDLYEAFAPGAEGRTWKDRMDWPEGIDRLSEVESDRRLRALAWEEVRRAPGRAVGLAARKAAYTWNPLPNWEGAGAWFYRAAAGLTCGPILLGALLTLARRGLSGGATWLLVAAPLVVLGVHMVFIGSVRYRVPVEPFLILLAAAYPFRRAGHPPPAPN